MNEFHKKLDSIVRVPLSQIDMNKVPDKEGICVLYHKSICIYVGESDDLYRRIKEHKTKGQSLSSSAFRRNICESLGIAKASDIRAGRVKISPQDVAKVSALILECEVGWIECDLSNPSTNKSTAVRHLKPTLNKN